MAILLGAASAATSQGKQGSASYEQAARYFNTQLDLKTRLEVQVNLLATGHLFVVPSDVFTTRTFDAILAYQAERGLRVSGLAEPSFRSRLRVEANELFRLWRFQLVRHPQRGHALWLPTGMGLQERRWQNGVSFIHPDRKVIVNYSFFPEKRLRNTYQELRSKYRREARVHYDEMKNDWFVLSMSGTGYDGYIRYHRDGPGITGFALFWDNRQGDVGGERIARLMSSALRAVMMDAPFLELPTVEQPRMASNQPSTGALPPPQGESYARAPPASQGISTGTGFFVGHDGTLVTNAHVVDGCRSIEVRTHNKSVYSAWPTARDSVNDLAILKVEGEPSRPASLRPFARLGEGVAAFGFPHTGLLATGGNFSTGNITALSGLGDDSRFYQMSTPVQSGNSGGPLLDQRGNVVGVVTSKLNALKLALTEGDFPQNVNFAVKTSLLVSFLSSNNIQINTTAISSSTMDWADVAEIARSISAFVICRK